MKPFQKREDPVALLKRRLLFVALMVIVGVMGRAVYGVYEKERESRIMRAEVERELLNLKERELEIRTDIAELASERGIEEALRSEYELAKSGESVIVIVGDEPVEERVDVSVKPMWWQFWQ